MKHSFRAAALFTSLAIPATSFACASCGCTLSPDWDALTSSSGQGFRLDVRYDYLDQNQLRHGTHSISAADASQIVNDGEPQEVEQFTRNNYLTLGLDYSPRDLPDWGVHVQLPYVDRAHSTLGTASDGQTAGPDGGQYSSHTASIGDAQVIGRYTGLLSDRRLALQFGLKLPTGSYTKQGASTDPSNPGTVTIDPGLQPGTGSMDMIAGLAFTDRLNPVWDYLVQGQFQAALLTRAGYRPGNGANLNLGLRYAGFQSAQPQLQLNVRYVRPDSGELADKENTGGVLVYLSPGANIPLTPQASLYAYMQLPLYQNVKGVQLVPHYTASVGFRYAF